jgi:hypothetical protein
MAKPATDQNNQQNPQNTGGRAFNPTLAADAYHLFDDLDFPANRSSIRRFAQDSDLGSGMLARIDSLPDQIYDEADQLAAALGNPANIPDQTGNDRNRGIGTGMDEDEAADMDSNEEPSHLSTQAIDPGEFKQSALESKRPVDDGRDD